VALVITLLLLVLMIALTLAMVIATSSDTLINHYYRNFRSSFYAADSGLNIARQSMANQLQTALDGSAVNLTTNPPSLPLAAGTTESAVQTSVCTTYGGGQGSGANCTGGTYISINSGQAGSSWPGKFEITSVCLQSTCNSSFAPTCQVGMSAGSRPSNTPVLSGLCGSIVLPTFTSKPPCASPVPAGCGSITSIDYLYPYTMTAIGQSMANEQVTLVDSGYMSVNVTVGTSGSTTSFAAFGTFLDQYPGWPNCGNPFAGGTFTGKVYTNQGWTWGLGQNYTFAGQIGSVSPNFYWNYGNTGNCDSTANLSDTQGGNSITPTWDVKPPQLGIQPVVLPPNDFNQKEAVLDGLGNGNESPTSGNMAAILKDVNGNPYPATGTTTPGVYLPYTTSGSTNTFAGGGIYVEGDANVTLTSSTSGSDNVQVFTITQGTNGSPTTTTGAPNVTSTNSGGYTTTTTVTTTTTTTPAASTVTNVTIDLTKGTTSETSTTTTTTQSTYSTTTVVTKVKNSNGQSAGGYPQSNTTTGNNPTTTGTNNATLNLAGEPENLSQSPEVEGAMLYVDGNIDSLSGPGGTAPAIQNGSAVTVTAADNVTITGNILYANEPVTLNSSDSLIPANNFGQVLGIFTANPNGVIGFSVPNNGDNIEVDASMAAISSGGSGSVYNIGNSIGTMTWVGGRIANTTNVCNCNQRNIYFDQRFAQGFAPPWFPTTTIVPGSNTGTVSTVTVQRTQWVDQTAW